MEQNAFDVFFAVKNYLYLGDYNKCLEEISTMDINEDDMSQRVKKNFHGLLHGVIGTILKFKKGVILKL